MKPDNNFLWANAYHEADHAIVGWALDSCVFEIRICGDRRTKPKNALENSWRSTSAKPADWRRAYPRGSASVMRPSEDSAGVPL